jgi:hypothetical protein
MKYESHVICLSHPSSLFAQARVAVSGEDHLHELIRNIIFEATRKNTWVMSNQI